MMQKVQRWSQPCCTCTKARARPANSVTRCAAVSRAAMMSDTAAGASGAQLSGCSFSWLPSTRCTPGSRAQDVGVQLHGAAGDDDARARPFARRAADRLARLAFGLGRHRAGVDDHRVVQAGGVAAHHLAFVGVQAAAEGEDLDAHAG